VEEIFLAAIEYTWV